MLMDVVVVVSNGECCCFKAVVVVTEIQDVTVETNGIPRHQKTRGMYYCGDSVE